MKKVALFEAGKKKKAQEKGRQPLFRRSYLHAAKFANQQNAETQTVARPKPFNTEQRLSKMPFFDLSNEELVKTAPKEASKVAEAEAEAGYCAVM